MSTSQDKVSGWSRSNFRPKKVAEGTRLAQQGSLGECFFFVINVEAHAAHRRVANATITIVDSGIRYTRYIPSTLLLECSAKKNPTVKVRY